MRGGATWHDGKPLTADDVVASIKTWMSPDNFSSHLASEVIKPNSVRTRGPLTVELTLNFPMADFPAYLTLFNFHITRPDIYRGADPIGTGPFKFKSFTPGKQSVFVANKDYWGLDGGPYVEEQIVDSSFTDETARINALLAGSIDIAPRLPTALAKAHADSGKINLGKAPGLNSSYFQCRVDQAPFNDPRVMEALRLSCNRPQMVKSIFSGYAQESNDLPGAGFPYYAGPDVFPIRQYDPDKAKSLLKAAGHEDLHLSLYTSPVAAGLVDAATGYASQSRASGLNIKVARVDQSIYFSPQGPGDGYLNYPMMTSASYSSPSLTSYHLMSTWTKAPYNETHFGDAATDRLLFGAIGELDPSRAQEKWNAFHTVQYERGGSIVFGTAENLDGYGKHIRGVKTTTAGAVDGNDVSEAWIAR